MLTKCVYYIGSQNKERRKKTVVILLNLKKQQKQRVLKQQQQKTTTILCFFDSLRKILFTQLYCVEFCSGHLSDHQNTESSSKNLSS